MVTQILYQSWYCSGSKEVCPTSSSIWLSQVITMDMLPSPDDCEMVLKWSENSSGDIWLFPFINHWAGVTSQKNTTKSWPVACLPLYKRPEENKCGDQVILPHMMVEVRVEGTLGGGCQSQAGWWEWSWFFLSSVPACSLGKIRSSRSSDLPVKHLSSAQKTPPHFPHLPLPNRPLKPAETFTTSSCLILKSST